MFISHLVYMSVNSTVFSNCSRHTFISFPKDVAKSHLPAGLERDQELVVGTTPSKWLSQKCCSTMLCVEQLKGVSRFNPLQPHHISDGETFLDSHISMLTCCRVLPIRTTHINGFPGKQGTSLYYWPLLDIAPLLYSAP